jgi:hypothetical protein
MAENETLANLLRGRNRAGQPVDATANIIGPAMSALGNTIYGAGRGALTAMAGLPGDINQLITDNLGTLVNVQGLPTTQEIQDYLPAKPTSYEGKLAQKLGEFVPVNPTPIAKGAVAIAKPVGKAMGEQAYRMTEDMLQKQGMMPSIVPTQEMLEVELKNNTKLSTTEKLKIAQKNATLPVEEGGLGLPPKNTPMDRAKAMGYDTPVYHGTNKDIEAFNVEGKGKTAGSGAFFTTNPTAAETYVSSSGGGNILPLLLKKDDFLTANAKGRNWADIYTNELNAKVGKRRYTPEELGLDVNSATTTDELGQIANELSLKGTEIKNVKDLGPNSHVMRAKQYLLEKYGIVPDETWSNVTGKQFTESQDAMKKFYESQKGDIYAVQDPSLIRSRFAAFDPKRRKEADILAGALAVPVATDEDTRRKLLEKLFKETKN